MNLNTLNKIRDIIANDEQLTRTEAKLLELIFLGISNSKPQESFVSETKYYTQAEVRRMLGVHYVTLDLAKRTGALRPRRVLPGIYRYRSIDIEEAILRRSMPPIENVKIGSN